MHLQAPREDFGEAREFRETYDTPGLRNVCDVALAYEWRKMMLADRGDVDVFDDDHLIMLIAGQRHDVLVRVFAHACGQLRVHLCDALRCILKAGTQRVFADAFKNHPHAARDKLKVNARRFLVG